MRRLAVTLAVALTVTFAVVRAAEQPRAGTPGVYFGWLAGDRARLQLLADPCPAPDATISLTLGENRLELGNARLGVPMQLNVAHLAEGASAPVTLARSARFACRDGDAGVYPIGAAALVALPAPPTGSPALVVRAGDPTGEVAARLLVLNGGSSVVLESIHYAPRGWARGTVRAAGGSRAQIDHLERALGPSVDPAGAVTITEKPSAWDAAHLDPADPRALRPRRAEALGLELGPGEAALILLDQSSLARSPRQRPVVLYPVVTFYEPATGVRTRLGSETPLVGVTRSWLGRSGG